MKAQRRAWALLTALALGACGGRVNLGGEATAAPPETENDPADPDAPVGKLVAELSTDAHVHLMAEADDFLYLGSLSGLSRCRKSNCASTLESLPRFGANLASLQALGQSLGITHKDSDQTWLATYSLPLGEEERVVLRDLPSYPNDGARGVLFHDHFVYWGLEADFSLYRCQLPSCQDGPHRLGGYLNLGNIRADGDLIFWNVGSSIYRSSGFGGGTVGTLLPDELLSEVPANAETPEPGAFEVSSIEAGNGSLIAAINDYCIEDCEYPIFRWPSVGGPREQILISANAVVALFLFGEELAWVDDSAYPDFSPEGATLWSCLVSACAATRRKLGYVVPFNPAVVADETHLYWLEAEETPLESGGYSLENGQIRRAPRLTPSGP
jgi:hypothetical protein